MMNDCELLELAARALGVDFTWKAKMIQTGPADMYGVRPCREEKWPFLRAGLFWNPLADDGAALRMAAGLGLVISTDKRAVYVQTIPGVKPSAYASQGGPDHMENIRRAIVRAAAAIGEAME